ncbi:polysaccharide deacetylase family protein [Anaerostipes sp.]|uniref:polysaccharide deacetylase family protein n=1 Tax=Anaerostipes sp. TaxID=1872530 RepID=UPI0025C6BDFA|nr:polysaccharide deacetylase family protein [Anaerostipes sp.]
MKKIILTVMILVTAGTAAVSVKNFVLQKNETKTEYAIPKKLSKARKKQSSRPMQRHIDKRKKLIAFSFDDGPAKENTDRVVKALLKNHARATFFMLGQNAKYYPELVKEVKDSGNEVAGHSWNHPQLTKLGPEGVRLQMRKMNRAISKVTGYDVGLLRPPYGSVDHVVKKNINAPLILWSIDTLDWKTRNTDATVNTILKQAKDGDIILMHDIHKPSVAAAEKVLPLLKARGYEICTVSELLKAKGIKVKKGDVVVSASQIYRNNKRMHQKV